MTTKIQKWGNSLAVRLPKKLITRLGLRAGSEVMVDEREQTVLIKQVVLPVKTMGKRGWKQFCIPTNNKKENISGKIDEILYGKSY
ncbi:MAG: AbrB/MazE/SpoVT family DNA-binding domain-containing protein [bacterium]|nr:AbrB/MazE/SpoVT family DNA-binding domain-containing protein [bacterium]